MKIVFHGSNAANFRTGFEGILDSVCKPDQPYEIADVSDALNLPGEREHFETADVIIGIRLGANEPSPRSLKLYHAPAAGTDMIEIARLPKGAALANCYGHEHAIAEYVMTSLLLRHVPVSDADARLRQGDWQYWAGRPGALRTELGDRSIGLLGFGHIGKAIAGRAKAFSMKTVVANRSKVAISPLVDESYGLDQLPAFMGAADIIVVSLPLMDATKGIVDASALANMRPDALIINVGRGQVIDEQALFDALLNRRIGGAIIDTWYQYPSAETPVTPPSQLPFETLANLTMTPHMSGWTNGTVRRRQETIADNIRRLTQGLPLVNSVG